MVCVIDGDDVKQDKHVTQESLFVPWIVIDVVFIRWFDLRVIDFTSKPSIIFLYENAFFFEILFNKMRFGGGGLFRV